MKLKLNEQGYDLLKEELSENEATFSKTTNVMVAFDLMAKGEELSYTQVTKAHLANIIKILCNKLKWNEEPEEEQDFENQVEKDSNESTKVNEDEESNSNEKRF